MVLREGIEPSRPEGHRNLNPARLPFRHPSTSGSLFCDVKEQRLHSGTGNDKTPSGTKPEGVLGTMRMGFPYVRHLRAQLDRKLDQLESRESAEAYKEVERVQVMMGKIYGPMCRMSTRFLCLAGKHCDFNYLLYS